MKVEKNSLKLPSSKELREFAVGFVLVLAAMVLPSPGFGPIYTKLHTWVGNALVHDLHLASGTRLQFEASDEQLRDKPWYTTLRIAPSAPAAAILVPIDLRSLNYLPTATFIALSVASPLRSWQRNARMLIAGLATLVPFLLLLLSAPMLSFLGGTGPVRAFELSRGAQVLLQIVYRTLVVPPGMAYALPLLFWWGLLNTVGAPRAGEGDTSRHAQRASPPASASLSRRLRVTAPPTTTIGSDE